MRHQLANGAVACASAARCGRLMGLPIATIAVNRPTRPPLRAPSAATRSARRPGIDLGGGAAASNRVVCAICAIRSVSLGVHKFLNKYNTEGIIRCASVLTCGAGAVVMQIIGIVEGIMYLQMPDAQFDATYVQGRKGWF